MPPGICGRVSNRALTNIHPFYPGFESVEWRAMNTTACTATSLEDGVKGLLREGKVDEA